MSFESSFFEARTIDVSKKKKTRNKRNVQKQLKKNISLIRVNILRTTTLIMLKNENLVNNLAM
jgi:hypothetical protein